MNQTRLMFNLVVNRKAEMICGRSIRIINVVIAEMEKYEQGEYTENVMESIRILRDQSKFKFNRLVKNFIRFKLLELFNNTLDLLAYFAFNY